MHPLVIVDKKGAEWRPHLTVGKLLEFQRFTDVKFFEKVAEISGDGGPTTAVLKVFDRPAYVGHFLYYACQDVAMQRHIDRTEFCERVSSIGLDVLSIIVIGIIVEFYPDHQKEKKRRKHQARKKSRPFQWSDVWELAGVVGVDPLPLTLGQLVYMQKARDHSEWDKAAWISYYIASSKTKKKVTPKDFHPMYAEEEADNRAIPFRKYVNMLPDKKVKGK